MVFFSLYTLYSLKQRMATKSDFAWYTIHLNLQGFFTFIYYLNCQKVSLFGSLSTNSYQSALLG